MTVGMLLGCVQREFYPGVNGATARVLAAEGCDVVVPPDQGCCGALSVHAGREAEGLDYARALIDTFSGAGVERIVVNSAGCGSTMKDYAHLLADDPAYAERAAEFAAKTRDISEVLAELEPVAPRHPLPMTVAYHDACHLRHAQGVKAQPRAVLATIPGLVVKEIAEGGHVLRVGGHLQPDEPGAGAGAGRPEGRERRARPARSCWSRPIRAACCRSRMRWPARGARCRRHTWFWCWTRRCWGCRLELCASELARVSCAGETGTPVCPR